jgi:lysophospholipase L1-like esterase
MLFMRTISSVWFLPVLMLAWATPAMTAEPPAPIDHIEIALDRKTLELVREPGATAEITLTAVGPDGQRRLLDPAAATLTATTTEASGGVEVVTIEQGKIVPRDGGIAKITATVEQDGTKHSASTDLVVAPFYRDYHQCLVTKLFMGMEGTPVERLAKEPLFQKPHDVLCTFEEALEVIRRTDNLTRGIPKIIYLVGWQKGGHDHGFPAWDEVNPRLKLPHDATALESLRWLIREARRYNTTVSLHINMVDAYRHSPLWDEYVQKDLFAKDEAGNLLVAGSQIEGDDMYNVVYPREWEAGLAQRRIDRLIEMVPELKEGHTIHIDVFIAQRDGGKPVSPWHALPEHGGLTPDKYVEAQRKIFHYWRDRGFDVTGEGIFWAHPPGEGFTGLQAMSWWYPGDPGYQMKIPERLMARGRTDRGSDGDFRFGSSMHGEEIWQRDKETMPGFLGMFCRTTLPWYFLSRHDRLSFKQDVLTYSDGVVARTEEGVRTIRQGDFVLRADDDLFVPALWNPREIIAWSNGGSTGRKWRLPADWQDVTAVDLYRITPAGCTPREAKVPVADGMLSLTLEKEEAVSIVPVGSPPTGTIHHPGAADAAVPERPNDEWRLRHGERVAEVRGMANGPEILFIGDSITGGWRDIGREVWEREFVPRGAASIGIAGSQTQHILWQLDHGAVDGLEPRLVVLMIGVNNVVASPSHSAADIARGIETIVARLREKLPAADVLVLGTFPKDRLPDSPDRQKIVEVNRLIAPLADGERVRFANPGLRLLTADGTLPAEISPDGVHLSPAGYQLWADAMKDLVAAADRRVPDRFQLRPLPGHSGCAFTMYGVPGELPQLEQLVAVMQKEHLGNGFDPGPGPAPHAKPLFDALAATGWPVVSTCCADMQIDGGRCVLGAADAAAWEAMDRAGRFTAVQLGEWGYYFHRLSHNEKWWRDVYGAEFDAFKHLMKPAGLNGYDRRPTSKRECYESVERYFKNRCRDLLDRVISVNGHSHYEAYSGEWGARCIGLELGENIAFTQSKLAFARGASRQWQKPWSVQVSPWFAGACTTSGPLRSEGGMARGLDAGHSLSFYERLWLHSWFAGAAMVTPENSISIFFEQSTAPWTLTSHGRKAAEVFEFMQRHERGVPFTPVAIVLDHLAGYNGYMDKPWGILEPTSGDRQLRDLFDTQLFPGADHIHATPDRDNPEASYLRPTPHGEMFDVQLTGASAEMLASYPVLLLAGDIEFDDATVAKLRHALQQGSTLLLSQAHREALGANFKTLAAKPGEGRLEVLEPWTNPATGRAAAISADRLEQLTRDLLPVEITGGAIQYQINRTALGWVIELVNNAGVAKKPNQPATVDPAAVARVVLRPRGGWREARQWRTDRTFPPGDAMVVDVGPGSTAFVEWR